MPPAIAAREPKRSTAIPAGKSDRAVPKNPAVKTAPSAGRPSSNSCRSCGPIAGRPKLTNETAACAAVAAVSTARGERVCTARDYRFSVDRDAIARSQRRRQVEEARAEEHSRELALAERLEEVVTEREGARVDEEAFARMTPEDVALVREVLETPVFLEDADETGDGDTDFDPDVDEEADAEIARLQSEIANSRRRQLAYQRYVEALDS